MLQNEIGPENKNIETNNMNLSIRNSVWEAAESHRRKEQGESQREREGDKRRERKETLLLPCGHSGRHELSQEGPSTSRTCRGVEVSAQRGRNGWFI